MDATRTNMVADFTIDDEDDTAPASRSDARGEAAGGQYGAMRSSSEVDRFGVTFVCTGNRARSPLAAALFARYTAGLDVAVSSCGTMDVGSQPALDEMLGAAAALDLDLTAHRSQALTPDGLSQSDLVVGFEPAHVSTAVVDGGADFAKTFVLGELVANLVQVEDDEDIVSHARFVVAVADSRRIRTRPDPAYSIADPFHASRETMWNTSVAIDRLVRALVAGLFGVASASDDVQTSA